MPFYLFRGGPVLQSTIHESSTNLFPSKRLKNDNDRFPVPKSHFTWFYSLDLFRRIRSNFQFDRWTWKQKEKEMGNQMNRTPVLPTLAECPHISSEKAWTEHFGSLTMLAFSTDVNDTENSVRKKTALQKRVNKTS